MNDRELLELAYKAMTGGASLAADADMLRRWNPRDNDGDALRLAVRLGVHVRFFAGRVEVDAKPFTLGATPIEESSVPDEFSATRRAIVRAAAEIGRAMP